MGYPLDQRINNLITHLGEYEKVLDLERGFFAQCIEWGRDDAFFGSVFEEYKHLFESPETSFADGTNVPDDFLVFIRAKSVSTPANKPFTYIQPDKIPGIKRTGLLQGTVNSPKLWIVNPGGAGRKLKLWPNTVTGTMRYWRMPVKLYFDDQTLIDESVVDTMPTNSEPLIESAAWEYSIMQLVQMINMGKLTELKAQAANDLVRRFFGDATHILNPNPLTQP